MLRRLGFLSLIVFTVLACDSNDPDPTPVITQAVLTLERTDADATFDPRKSQTIRIDGLPNPTTTDTFYVVRGASYEGNIRFFDADGFDQTATVRLAQETSAVSYTLTGINTVQLVSTDQESDYGPNVIGDDLPVGLEYTVAVEENASIAEGTLRVQLERFANELKGSGTPQNVEVDFTLPLRLLRPGAQAPSTPDLITSLTLGFRSGGGIQIGRTNPGGYHVFSIDSLENSLMAGTTYASTFEPFNEAGESLANKIKAEGSWYQVFYELEGAAADSADIIVTDTDVDDLPLGLTYSMEIAPGAAGMWFGVRMRMAFYDPSQGLVKDGMTISDEILVDYLLRIRLMP